MNRLGRYRLPVIGVLAVAAMAAAVTAVVVTTAPVRDSVRAFTELLGAANRQDVAGARRLCTPRYVQTHPLRPAPDGGLVGLPRNIHKNFQAWRQGPHVWLCPTNRVGPVYQFVQEGPGLWRFDGPVGILRGGGRVVLLADGESFEPEPSGPGGD